MSGKKALQCGEKKRILEKKREGMTMKSLKSILKIVGIVMAVAGAALLIVSCLDEIRQVPQQLAAWKARREELRDYAD